MVYIIFDKVGHILRSINNDTRVISDKNNIDIKLNYICIFLKDFSQVIFTRTH